MPSFTWVLLNSVVCAKEQCYKVAKFRKRKEKNQTATVKPSSQKKQIKLTRQNAKIQLNQNSVQSYPIGQRGGGFIVF